MVYEDINCKLKKKMRTIKLVYPVTVMFVHLQYYLDILSYKSIIHYCFHRPFNILFSGKSICYKIKIQKMFFFSYSRVHSTQENLGNVLENQST